MPGAIDLGVADDCERPGGEQASQIAVTLLAERPSLFLPPLECCRGTSPRLSASLAHLVTAALKLTPLGINRIVCSLS